MLMMSQNRLAARNRLSAQDEAPTRIVETVAARLNRNGQR